MNFNRPREKLAAQLHFISWAADGDRQAAYLSRQIYRADIAFFSDRKSKREVEFDAG